MKKFDLMFEKYNRYIIEQQSEPTFEDNIKALLSMLKDNDLLDKNKEPEQYLKEIESQTEQIKQIVIGASDKAIPTIRLKLQQNKNDSNSFSVEVVNLSDPTASETYDNDWLETIFKNVINKVKATSLKHIAPESAVDTLPQEENPADSQPGAEQSALPGAN